MTGTRNPLHGLLRSCVVRVDIDRAFCGTGYFVAPGRVLTCAHVTVLRNVAADRVELLWRGLRAPATVVARCPDLEPGSARAAFWPYPDVALLALDDDTFDGHPCVRLDRDEPSEWPADRLFAYGHTKGEHDADAISETSATLEYEGPLIEGEQRYLKLKHGDVLRGMSGGPVLNVRTGGVCAIVESRRTVGAIAGGFGVPVAAFLDDVEDGLADRAAAFHRADRRWRIAHARTAGVRPMYVHHPHALLGDDAVVGRDAELSRIKAWLGDPGRPVFCLAGPGGQGKSALAWTALAHAGKAAAVRIWHSFGLDTRHDVALVASIVGAARGPMTPELDLDDALAVLGELGSLVVLDQVDTLFGSSGSLLDMLTPAHRTIADPRVEALIRRLAATEGVRLLLTARLRPAFLDDPVLAERCVSEELQPLDGLESAALWTGVGVPGNRADAVAATALLRGQPAAHQRRRTQTRG